MYTRAGEKRLIGNVIIEAEIEGEIVKVVGLRIIQDRHLLMI
ncbi:hypothetical protein N752_06360 [Desulforamulus aquiferis]|nr:hypothetical protein N752_06360 [Desulforamulus aquiferis]